MGLALFCTISQSQLLKAQSAEERFQDLFVTAGYSTAFGAALGAALLAFTPEPSRQLRYIAMGASLGFIGGSIMGTYIIFTPMLSSIEINKNEELALTENRESYYKVRPGLDQQVQQQNNERASMLSVSPYIDRTKSGLTGFEISYTLAIN